MRAKFAAAYGYEPAVITRAPGRIEFIGNHTDYNGGTVLGAAIDRAVWVAVGQRPGATERRFVSDHAAAMTVLPADGSAPRQEELASWVNYPLGVWAALAEFGLKQPAAFDYVAASDVPTGAGLSSSAAIELASALALLTLTGQQTDRATLVKIGRHAENHFVGVPCGILDQGVSGFGARDHLVFIDCRGPHFERVTLPHGVHFWIFNTHTKHALVDGLYAERHRECMAAARALGVGQLVDTTPAAVEAAKDNLTPEQYRRALHVTQEIARVDAARAALARGELAEVGRLLTASHRSSQTLFENSTPELDFLVDTLAATPHVHGARLTGGGFGGAVMAMTDGTFDTTHAAAVAEAYKQKFYSAPEVIHTETGEGAAVVS